MNWEKVIYDHFISGHHNLGRILLHDNTGICVSAQFLEYLSINNIKCNIVSNTAELLAAKGSDALLVIDDVDLYINIPENVKNSYEIIPVNHNSLPFNVEYKIYKDLSIKDTMLVMEYSAAYGNELITEHNYKEKLRIITDELLENRNTEILQDMDETLGKIKDKSFTYIELLLLGALWGEYVFNCFKLDIQPDQSVHNSIDKNISNYVLSLGLKNISYETLDNFKSVDRMLSYLKQLKLQKIALICFDGMGVAEWFLLKEILLESGDYSFSEKEIFSLIPTITRISRYAIYAENLDDIYENDSSSPSELKALQKSLPDSQLFKDNEDLCQESLLGFNFISKIYNIFDDIAHSIKVGKGECSKNIYFKIVKEHLLKTRIMEEIQMLLQNDFKIYFCSDHGCTIARGTGDKIAKHLIDTYSKRGTIVKENASVISEDYNIYKIPFLKNKNVILANPGEMFANKNVVEITHGGISAEELIVPFVELKDRKIK